MSAAIDGLTPEQVQQLFQEHALTSGTVRRQLRRSRAKVDTALNTARSGQANQDQHARALARRHRLAQPAAPKFALDPVAAAARATRSK